MLPPVSLLSLISGVVWRLPGRASKKLYGFAQAEAGSRLTLELAARQTTDHRRRALYLAHAAEEGRHARVFFASARRNALREGRSPPPSLRADGEDLFRSLGEAGFLAFLHHGEQRGRRRFELYRDLFLRLGDRRKARLFTALVRDEKGHEDYAWRELSALVGERQARRALLRVRTWEAWRAWRRIGRHIAELLYRVAMSVLFVTLLPLAMLVRFRRPAPTGWQRALPEE